MNLAATLTAARRVPAIAWVILFSVLLLTGGAVSLYHAGRARGRGDAQVEQHDAARSAATSTAAAALARRAPDDSAADRAARHRDSLAQVVASRADTRAGLQARTAAARATFSLAGDTATIAGDPTPVVLPPAIAEVLRLEDSTTVASDSLDAARDAADAGTAQLLARKDQQIADRDAALNALMDVAAADSAVITDLRAEQSPRLGFRAGVAVGATAAVGVLALVSHLFR